MESIKLGALAAARSTTHLIRLCSEEEVSGCIQRQLYKVSLWLPNKREVRKRTQSQKDSSDSEEDAEPTSDRQLRNGSLLQKPKQFEDHIMEAVSYLDDYNHETYEEAVNSKDSTNWKKAMESKMNSLSENNTWELTDLPVGAKATSCKRVYKLKTNPDGSINKHKARLVARGFRNLIFRK
ncbi:retrovirus-related Pol polyprotein from transposon TNT 1-94 [Trichonephila clavipes]|nr:retrovirus-related Pol polyprotein from transposon TNT 1-94 [Trichonephila clavipes]